MATGEDVAHLPEPCLVVLVGPSSSGKSTWAAAQFAATEIVSSDRLRAVVGHGEDDLDASADAFALLDTIIEQRTRRGLTTVVDTLGLDPERRRAYLDVAGRHGLACVAVGFDTTVATVRARNRERARPLPVDVITRQVAQWADTRARLDDEGYAMVLRPATVKHVPKRLEPAAQLAATQRTEPTTLRFGLHLSAFDWPGERIELAGALRTAALAAEQAGFDSVWVMDHMRQIPQVGRDWDPMLECYTTLAWLAAVTESMQLGALVTPITFRNPGLLAKIIATLDVLSSGRARCGLGLGWYEREHAAYGWAFPPTADRYALLEDTLRALPVLWGPGSKPFEGRAFSLPETICYPRPVQDRIPILVGGGGERRTLRLAAKHADAVNVMVSASGKRTGLEVLRQKIAVLRSHCADIDRDPDDVAVTVLSPTLAGTDRTEVQALVEQLRPRRLNATRYAAQVNAATVDDQIGRFRELADAGVSEVMVSLPDLGTVEPVAPIERFAAVIEAFRTDG